MAAAFTSLGLAGLLVATFLPGMLGTAASAPQRESLGGAAQSPAPAPDEAYGVKDGEPTNAPDVAVAGGRGTDAPGVPEDTAGRQLVAAPLSPLLIGSFVVLAVGLLLFGLRFVARRVR
jgi:hypothetical protein